MENQQLVRKINFLYSSYKINHLMDGGINNELPYIFIIDIDGTMVGNVSFQVHQFTLHNTLKKHGFKSAKQYAIPPAFNPNAKLVRPGFGNFIKTMQKFYNGNVHFFVYTASEKQWANQEIAWIEKTHDIKFTRPIFTRDDCIVDAAGNYRKTIGRVFPRIMRIVCKQKSISNHDKSYILENQLLIIDNNAVYTDRSDKLLLCPDYNYAVFENLLHGVPNEARQHPDIQKSILSLVNQGVLCPTNHKTDDAMRILARQYEWLHVKCKTLIEINTSFEDDEFWHHLRKLILENQLKTYTVSIIKQLQEAVWKRYKKKRAQSASTHLIAGF